jgi:hypothetical protein
LRSKPNTNRNSDANCHYNSEPDPHAMQGKMCTYTKAAADTSDTPIV